MKQNDLQSKAIEASSTKRIIPLVLVVLCAGAILFWGCATTQYGNVEVSQLTDPQLIEELTSAQRELGIQADYTSALLAIDTSPRPVITSASTTYSGNINAEYNRANQTLYGSFHGSGYTTYQYTDANGGARFAQGLALLINASNIRKLEDRRKAVLTEISRRRDVRENMERITRTFLAAHPEISENRDLLIACLLITQHRTNEPLDQLQQVAEIMRKLPKDRWIGWVEAHGDPHHPYGVVVGSYFMDVVWDGEMLTGKGRASDGSEMTLTAKKNDSGILEGTIRGRTMEAKFVGRMTTTALCVDYKGTESGQAIRGITWAFRNAEHDLPLASASVGNEQNGTFPGRYIGKGKAVSNGIEQPYQITLDISDSGTITFICTAAMNGQQLIVKGRGTVDAKGNVVVQNEFGAIGRGYIKGKVLKAGGESADGSLQSNFIAEKQE